MNKTSIIVLVLIALGILFWIYKSKNEVSLGDGATVVTQSVASDTSSASAIQAGAKTVTWKTGNYPKDAGVNINLVRKVSDSPKQFELVRVLAENTANDGSESWTPRIDENTGNLYVEVTCSSAYQFSAGCSLSGEAVLVN